ncbi:hypothetical protein AB4254_08105 [Vibrio breoganii]
MVLSEAELALKKRLERSRRSARIDVAANIEGIKRCVKLGYSKRGIAMVCGIDYEELKAIMKSDKGALANDNVSVQ